MTMETEQDIWCIYDLRGLVIHTYSSGTDPDYANKKIRSPGHTLDKFIDRYLLPCSQIVPLNKISAVHDAGNEFRRALDPNYKNRPEMEPELKMSVEASRSAVRELLHGLGIAQCSVAGTEADDVIAYLVENLPGRKLVYTVDGDLVALSSPVTTVFLKGEPQTNYIYKRQDFRIEVLPRHVTLFKSIVGDTSDNIKGVPGMGPKAWVDLAKYVGPAGLDDLSNIVSNSDVASLKIQAEHTRHPLIGKLFEGSSSLVDSWQLAVLRPEIVESRHGNEFRRIRWEKRLPSRERIQKLAMTASAYWLEEEINHLLPNQYLILAADWEDNTLAEATALFKQSRFIAIDWESYAPENENFRKASESSKGGYVDMLGSTIASMGLTCGENLEHTFYFSFDHADTENNIAKDRLIELLNCVPEGTPIVAQNAVFERTLFVNEFGYDIPNLHDTKIMASHVDESLLAGLKDMSKHWLNYNQTRYNEVIEPGKTMKDYPAEHVFKYGADDPFVTAHLYDLFYMILRLEGTWEFVRDYEFPMTYILSDAYLAGVSIDYDAVEQQRAEDQLTYDTNIEKVRALLRLNLTKDAVAEGTQNWLEELLHSHECEANHVIEQIEALYKTHKAGYIPYLRADKMIEPWVRGALTSDATVQELITEVQERLNRDKTGASVSLTNPGESVRAVLRKQAIEAATYQEYVEIREDAKFQWSLGHVNKLAETFGLGNFAVLFRMVGNKEYKTFVPAFEITDNFTITQNHFLEMVATTSEAALQGKHTKCPAYQWLQIAYKERFEGTLKKSGTELNMDSPKQMVEFFYAILGLPIRLRNLKVSDSRAEKGMEGAPQSNEDVVLMAIAMGDAVGWKREVLELMLEAKKANTRIKLFYNKLPLWRHPLTGRIHPGFINCGAETRRITGTSPNLLQLSKKGDGLKVRRGIIPNQNLGHDLIVALDFDGEELRIMAGLSGDEAMTSCYVGDNKRNVHSLTGSGIARTSYEEFVVILKDPDHPLNHKYSDIRKDSKGVNFLSAYGGGKAKLARKLLCPIEIAGEYLQAKKNTYFGFEEWRTEEIEKLHARGYIETLYGTRKHVYNKLCGSDTSLVSYYERSAINQLVQGVAADYVKVVMTDIYKKEILKRYGANLIAIIYDEFCFSIRSDNAVGFIKEIYASMTQGIPGLPIPMLVNPSVGINFADQVEVLDDANDELTDERILAAIAKAFKPKEEVVL